MNFFMNRKHKRTWLISEIFHGSPPRGINLIGLVRLARNIANAGSRQGGGRLGEMTRCSRIAPTVSMARPENSTASANAPRPLRGFFAVPSAADLNFLVHHVAVRHPEWFSDEVAPVDGGAAAITNVAAAWGK